MERATLLLGRDFLSSYHGRTGGKKMKAGAAYHMGLDGGRLLLRFYDDMTLAEQHLDGQDLAGYCGAGFRGAICPSAIFASAYVYLPFTSIHLGVGGSAAAPWSFAGWFGRRSDFLGSLTCFEKIWASG